MLVLFVGQSIPLDHASDTDPFEDTSSGRRLQRWIDFLIKHEDRHLLVNACSEPGADKATEEDLETLEYLITSNVQPSAIVALGKVAAAALEEIGVPFFELPHPSGLSRAMNNAPLVQSRLDDCFYFLYAHEKKGRRSNEYVDTTPKKP